MKILLPGLFAATLLIAQSAESPVREARAGSTSAPGNAVSQPAADTGIRSASVPGLLVNVNRSIVLEHAAGIRRISIANAEIAEAVAISSTEVLVNGKAPGETTLILWDPKGNRSTYEVQSMAGTEKVDAVRDELMKEVGPGVSIAVEGESVFLRGTVNDQTAADRAASIAGTLGKVVNLLRVLVPPSDPQVLLKVRFATVSRSAVSQLGVNLFSFAPKGVGNLTTGQFGQPPQFQLGSSNSQLTFSDLLNIFYFRPDLNAGALIQALEAKNLVQILAEPNLLTVSGRPASFLAGGEFPFPTIQGGAAGVGQITVEFKEFGIRLNFLPAITPRGTIHLVVTPEVSSLDYSNGLTVNGFTVPGLATRRVQTEVELENGQSFVIAGLLDNHVTEQLDKMPGLANIPVLGKLFQSRSLTKSNDELMVLVTPELVAPIPAGVKAPDLKMPQPFLKGSSAEPPQNPGPNVTGAVPPIPKVDSLPIEELKRLEQSSTPDSGSAPNASPQKPAPFATALQPQASPATPGTGTSK